tara:strand:- start:1226 stop:2497 length:1272 start_codon:yes stop_codon:yes gene_type:complete
MDPHTESAAVAEAEPEESPTNLEALPDEGDGDLSFEASLEAALSGLHSPKEEETTEEVAEEPAEEVVAEEPAEEVVAEEPAKEEVAEEEDPTEALTEKDAEEATEETTEEATEEEDPIEALTEDVGDDWTPKAASRFKQLKAELKSSKAELDTLRHQQTQQEAKIKELTGLAENKDVEVLQTKLAEYEQKQMFSNLEETDVYKQAITEPLAELMKQSDQLADKYDVDPNALVDVLSIKDQEKQDEQLDELIPDATDRDKAKIFRIMEDINPIVQRRQELFDNSEAALAEAKVAEEQKETQLAAEKAKLRVDVAQNVVERVQQKLPFLSGLDDLDMEAVQTKAAESDPSVIHPVDHAYNAVSAQLLPNIVKAYMSMRKENELLTDRLADYETAEPAMSGQTKDSTIGAGRDMSFEESITAALGG